MTAKVATPKSRGIIFTAESIRSIQAGTKTQTRRIVKPGKYALSDVDGYSYNGQSLVKERGNVASIYPVPPCPFGGAGDHLWVREGLVEVCGQGWHYKADGKPIALAADDPRVPAMVAWAHHKETDRCSSRHMPRWASRITLELVSVRVERLQDITEEDAKAEGVTLLDKPKLWDVADDDDWNSATKGNYMHSFGDPGTYLHAFRAAWHTINGKRASWASDPWVWRLEFRKLEASP